MLTICLLFGISSVLTPHLYLQLAAGFQALVRGVASKALNICCFNGANITVLNRLFLNTIDPIPEIEDVLVSHSLRAQEIPKANLATFCGGCIHYWMYQAMHEMLVAVQCVTYNILNL